MAPPASILKTSCSAGRGPQVLLTRTMRERTGREDEKIDDAAPSRWWRLRQSRTKQPTTE